MVTEIAGEASLTDVEQLLVDHVTRGELLDLAAGGPVDEAAMRSWDSTRTVRAAVLRDILRGRLAPNPDPHGLRLRGARIAGRLDLENLTTNVGVQLSYCLLDEGLVARDATLPLLVLSGCRLEHPDQLPLAADRLTASYLAFDRAVITARCENDAVRLPGAHLGTLACSHATIRNDSGPALGADGLQVDQAVFFKGRFNAVGTGETGAVRLAGGHLGRLECDGATIRNKGRRDGAGPALVAFDLQVDDVALLRKGFMAVGAGEAGAVDLAGAHIGGDLDCSDATMRNDCGPALLAGRLQVDGDVHLDRLKAVGDGDGGAVQLPGAHIGGLLDCTSACMSNKKGPALVAYSLQVDQKVVLDRCETVGAGKDETLNLLDVRVGGVLVFDPERLKNTTNSQARLALDGLTYTGLPLDRTRLPEGISVDHWLDLLRKATRSYAAQPYQQFAAAHRAAGNDGKVRKILMDQRRDQIDRGALDGLERAWARLTGLTLGYGYQPWRALIALVVVAAISVGLAVTLGAHGGLARVDPQPPTATQCSVVERVGVGLDLGLPLVKTGARDYCDVTISASGQALTVAGWGLQLLAWAFATLFVAGFTGIVRKT
jgi:hypothetical protein